MGLKNILHFIRRIYLLNSLCLFKKNYANRPAKFKCDVKLWVKNIF